MTEYIEREKAFDAVFGQFCASSDETEAALNAAIEEISAIPASDVRPVVRGKWRFEIGDGKTCVDGWVCSACNCGFHTNVPYFEGFNFCPNCGADMREES